jgi:hypothetical protein
MAIENSRLGFGRVITPMPLWRGSPFAAHGRLALCRARIVLQFQLQGSRAMPQFVNAQFIGVNIDRVLWYQIQEDESLKISFGGQNTIDIDDKEMVVAILSACRKAAAPQESEPWNSGKGI